MADAEALGIFLALVGLLFTVIGYAQHHATWIMEKPPPGTPQPIRWPTFTAAVCCVVTCALIAVYLGGSA